MKKTIITILSTALVVAGSAAVVNAASGGPEREATTSSPATESKQPNKRATARAAVNCKSLRCINRNLTKLKRDAFKCSKLVNLTAYSGYLFSPDGGNTVGLTTALDFTESGVAPSRTFVIYTC